MASSTALPHLRSHSPKKHGKGVAFRVPKKASSKKFPDIFSDHWLVESPRRIQFEKTTLGEASPMETQLQDFYENVANIPEKYITKAKTRTKTLMEYLIPRVTKLASQIGMKLHGWKYAGSTTDNTQVIYPKGIDLFLLFEKFKFKTDYSTPGYCVVPLKRFRQKEGEKLDQYRFGRYEGTCYLSSMLVAANMYSFVERALKNNPQVQLQPFIDDNGYPQIVITFKDKHVFNIIPATFLEKEELYLNTRPYAHEHDPMSSKNWRLNYVEKERNILKTLDKADRGMRRKAFKTLKALVKVEHTLQGLTSYHIKTVMLHSIDHEIDHERRWQHHSLEGAFMTLLEELLVYLRQRELPHFFIRNYNLFENMNIRTLKTLETRISYLVHNPQELLRILHKRMKKT